MSEARTEPGKPHRLRGAAFGRKVRRHRIENSDKGIGDLQTQAPGRERDTVVRVEETEPTLRHHLAFGRLL